MAEEATQRDDQTTELTVEGAAAMLGESVSYLMELLDIGAIGFRVLGGMRLIEASELEDFRIRREFQLEGMAEMSKLIEDSPPRRLR